ncbi:hypothetical protein [Spirillospora sp. NPDC029432]|uniref:hypothetical protein n=1 Tax=Spirillospora sp. NPDC029432 TaxID=3154599 RepID=UPI003451998B
MTSRRRTAAALAAAAAASVALAGCGGFRGVVQGASESGGAYGRPQSPPPPEAVPGEGAPGNGAPVPITAIRVGAPGPLGTIVADNAGRTLYRFDRDRARPSASTCAGACSRMWPPVRYSPELRIAAGIPRARVGQVTRPDGTLQLTLGGWPLYRYARDAAPGDASGHGVNGAWYAVRATGAKAVPGGGTPLPPGFGPRTGGSGSGGDGGVRPRTAGGGSTGPPPG